MLAAGLWAAAATGAAAAEPGPSMQLGSSALPPQAYVAFCERQPWDCGAEPRQVLARAEQADVERAALFAAASAVALSSLPGAEPAALLTSAAATTQSSASQALKPAAAPVQAPVARAEAITRADFIRPATTLPAPAKTYEAGAEPAPEAPTEAHAGPVRMTPQLWSKLNRVNDQVNRAILQATDLATYGKVDYWSTPLEDGVRTGDCEDYALEKMRALIAAGVPREALNLAVVTTSWGESHAVLLVDTSEGSLVLDNLSDWVKPWYKTTYRWRERQVGGDPFTWAMVVDPAHARPAGPAGDRLIVAAVR